MTKSNNVSDDRTLFDQFNKIGTVLNSINNSQGKSVELQIDDREQRAKAEDISEESSLGDLDLNIKKSSRSLREQTLATSGAAIQLFTPGKSGFEKVVQLTALVRGLISLRDAWLDKEDIHKKYDDLKLKVEEKKKSRSDYTGSKEKSALATSLTNI